MKDLSKLTDYLWFEFADENNGLQTTMNYESFAKLMKQLETTTNTEDKKGLYLTCGSYEATQDTQAATGIYPCHF